MTTINAIILGVVQGSTEFIPVSSSGHLIIARELLGLNASNALSVDAIFQLATILAVGVYFFKDLIGLFSDRALMAAVALGTIPAVVFGLSLEKTMETSFRSSELVAWMLLAGALLMMIAERYGRQNHEITPKRGWYIGLFQVLALIPGVSRSGATISGGLLNGLTREEATRFSFILSFPIIAGSGLKKLIELESNAGLGPIDPSLWLGALVAFAVGLAAIHFLIKYLRSHSLKVFILYRVVLALVILAWF